jgi:DDE superfamily endonuclease
VLNMDESGARIGCLGGQHIIVPIEVKELYTSSLENRKSVTIIETIIADGRKPLPPFIITPGKKIIDNWIAAELVGTKQVACSPTGYTNNEIAIQYLDHLIKYLHASSTKAWKILLLNGHESHCIDAFQLKAAEHHIKLFYFPSHLTHMLQPLDVGIFRPWKHYHSLAVQAALRSLDFEYTITSFFQDLTSIRQQTMKYHTIINSFKDSGMWPVSPKARIKKMQSYRKRKRTIHDIENDTLDLLALPPTRPAEVWTTAATVQAFGDRDPTQFSEPSVLLFHKTMDTVDIQL